MNEKLGRYLAFAFDDYYPAGGWGDLVGAYNTLQEAAQALRRAGHHDNYQVIDARTGEEFYVHEIIEGGQFVLVMEGDDAGN